jgi:hypothetical protein
MKKILFPILIASMLFSSCELLQENLPAGLTDQKIIDGLKTALNVGTDSSSTSLSLQDGYYGNSLLKIPLPDEAIKVQNEINAILNLAPTLSSYLNLDAQFENVVKSVNRAAEDAAKDAAPIFKNAITDLNISQGLEILQGQVPDSGSMKSAGFDSTAATNYLKMVTFSPLTDLYAPKIDLALDKDLGLGFSANDAWKTLRRNYNAAVNNIKGNFIANLALEATGYNLETLQTESIGVFATENALKGLFLKVGEQEIKIRRDPWQWVSTVVGDILTKVFGAA